MPLPAPTIKICGLKTLAALEAVIRAGADMAGFVFFARSPRHISFEEARVLGECAQGRIKKVALTVDASDNILADIIAALRPDFLQLHGHETPERALHVRRHFGLPVIKAIGLSGREDLAVLPQFEAVADWLLLDAKPPVNAAHPGGNGRTFDWDILAGLSLSRPWLLSGGLDAHNVGEAVSRTHAPGVDVSSGVESAPGVKDEGKIAAFVRAVRALGSLPKAG